MKDGSYHNINNSINQKHHSESSSGMISTKDLQSDTLSESNNNNNNDDNNILNDYLNLLPLLNLMSWIVTNIMEIHSICFINENTLDSSKDLAGTNHSVLNQANPVDTGMPIASPFPYAKSENHDGHSKSSIDDETYCLESLVQYLNTVGSFLAILPGLEGEYIRIAVTKQGLVSCCTSILRRYGAKNPPLKGDKRDTETPEYCSDVNKEAWTIAARVSLRLLANLMYRCREAQVCITAFGVR